MTISIQISAENPADLQTAIRALADAFGGGEAFTRALVGAQVATDEKSVILATDTTPQGPAPEPPPPPQAEPTPPKANVVTELTPAEMRQKGSDMLLAMFNRDPTTQPILTKVQNKYGVRRYSEIPDDKAQEFYNDALLAANGTGEVKTA